MMRFVPILACAALAACSAPQPPLVASDVEITPPVPGRPMRAGYFVLTNNSDEPVVINGVTSPQFGAVEMHETVLADGIARMRPIEELIVPARGSVALERGGKHLMLMRARQPAETVSLQLLSNGAPVLSIDYTPVQKAD